MNNEIFRLLKDEDNDCFYIFGAGCREYLILEIDKKSKQPWIHYINSDKNINQPLCLHKRINLENLFKEFKKMEGIHNDTCS